MEKISMGSAPESDLRIINMDKKADKKKKMRRSSSD